MSIHFSTTITNNHSAITGHPQWRPEPNPNPTLSHIWDFVMRSKYMPSEYDNIKAWRPTQRPEQFRDGASSGDEAALRRFQDVCGRTMMLDMMHLGEQQHPSLGRKLISGKGLKMR
ncbi:hypothetical protein BDZ45DRAFT_742618 [Acephala macrosclerotiorum]|nr:hypothetical protein BDZ45DRAFT_742618 [Acephala macrosclerotiorum]